MDQLPRRFVTIALFRKMQIAPENIEISQDQTEKLDLAREAFAEFYAECFWYMRSDLPIGSEDIPEIARGLRRYGGKRGLLMAERLGR